MEWKPETQGEHMRDSRAKFHRKLTAWAMTLCLGGCATDSQRANFTSPPAREVLPAALARKLPAAEIADRPDHWDADLPTVALDQQNQSGLEEPARPAVSPPSVKRSQDAALTACRPVAKSSSRSIQLAASSEPEQKPAINAPKPLDLPDEAQPAKDAVPPAPGADNPAEGTPLDLSSVLVMAAGRNPQVAFAQERIREAWARQQAADVLWLPSLQAGVNYYKHEGALQAVQGPVSNISRGGLYSGFGARAIGAANPAIPGLFAKFALNDAIHQPEITAWQTNARCHASAATRNQVLLDMALAYLKLLEAYQSKAISLETLANAEQLAELTKSFADAGQGSRADADRAATELTLRQNAVEQANESVQVASARLAQLLSIDPTMVLFPTEPALIPMDLISGEQTPQELVSLGLKTRPELAESTALVQAATKELDRVRQAPLLPSLLLGMSYGGFGGGVGGAIANYSDRFDFEATAYWQVRNLGFGEKSARNEARSQYQQAQIQQVRRLDQVAREVVEAQSQVQARRRQIDIARKGIETARDSHRRNLERIQDGQGLPIEVLQSLQALDGARREYLRTVVDYNEAQFRLQWAIGWPVQ